MSKNHQRNLVILGCPETFCPVLSEDSDKTEIC